MLDPLAVTLPHLQLGRLPSQTPGEWATMPVRPKLKAAKRREKHPNSMQRDAPGPGQESVWDYPRPPRLERSSKSVRVIFARQVIAQSSGAYRVLETSHPPNWYIPRDHVRMEFMSVTAKQSFCEWKGQATYWTVRVGSELAENVAWSYESPQTSFAVITGYPSFYPGLLECYVDEERVKPQPGRFYGGWITTDVTGPFKGAEGSRGW